MVDNTGDGLRIIGEVGTATTKDSPCGLGTGLSTRNLECTFVDQNAEGRLRQKRNLEGEADAQGLLGAELNEDVVEIGVEPGGDFITLTLSVYIQRLSPSIQLGASGIPTSRS